MAENKNVKLVTEDADPKEVAENWAKTISSMYEDRDRKALTGKARIVDKLEILADKYRTANGVMAALGCVRDVFGEQAKELTLAETIDIAKGAANELSGVANKMRDKLMNLDPDDEMFANVCDGFFNKAFSGTENDAIDMVVELMRLQLCQQVGPDTHDLVDFCNRTDEEIKKSKDDLMLYCEQNDVNFYELCDEPDEESDYLCYDCQHDCKDVHKTIKEGQSAYDVCEKFVEKED